MIDENWLADLKFEAVNGVRVDGLLGIGEERVVLRGVTPDGVEVALTTRRHLLGYHIREVPPQIARQASYRIDTLNRKLSQLVDMPGVDEMISDWDRLFSLLTKLILEHGVPALSSLPFTSAPAYMLVDSLPLLIHSNPIRRRLLELVDLGVEGESIILTVNGPNFPVTEVRSTLVKKAKDALHSLGSEAEFDQIERNPLFVWGGAAMEGFFDRAREHAAVEYIRKQYGPLVESPDVTRLFNEVDALANVFAFFFGPDSDREAIIRFTAFCARCGFAFEVRDSNGGSVASGLSFMFDK